MRYADRLQEYPRPMKTVYTLAESLAQDILLRAELPHSI